MNKLKIIRKWKISQNEDYKQRSNNDDTIYEIAERIIRKTFMYIDENCKKRKIYSIEIRIYTTEAIINFKEKVEFNSVKSLKETIQLSDILVNEFNSIEGLRAEELNNSFVGLSLKLED